MKILHGGFLDSKIVIHVWLAIRKLKHNYLHILWMFFMSCLQKTLVYHKANIWHSFVKSCSVTKWNICVTYCRICQSLPYAAHIKFRQSFIQKIIRKILHAGLLDTKIVMLIKLVMRNLKLKYLHILWMLFRSWLEKTLINYIGNKCNSFVKLSNATISNISPIVLKISEYLSMA